MHDPTQPTLTRRIDGYLFTQALRQTIRAAQLIAQDLTDKSSPNAEAAREAIERFEARVPDAKNARDVLNHFDDYARGIGNLSHPGIGRLRRVATDDAAREYWTGYELTSDGQFLIRFGTLSINIEDAHLAVQQLSSDLHSAVGLVTGSHEEAMASFGPSSEDNPAYIAVVFFALVAADDFADDAPVALRYLVTPESIPAWGDFSDTRAELRKRSITSKVEELVAGRWVYVKLPIGSADVRQAVDAIPLLGVRFLLLQHRPDLGNVWRVHAVTEHIPAPYELPG